MQTATLILDFRTSFVHHVVRGALGGGTGFVQNAADLFGGPVHLGLQIGAQSLCLLAGLLGFCQGSLDILLAALGGLQPWRPG